jgi:hypothetical protein
MLDCVQKQHWHGLDCRAISFKLLFDATGPLQPETIRGVDRGRDGSGDGRNRV